MTLLDQSKYIASILDSKKATDIKILDVDNLTTLANYFVIASANNSTLVKSLADEIEFQLKQEGIEPQHIEGRRSDTWILLDYGNIVVHILLDETRKFYDIERMWCDATEIDITDIDKD